MSINQQVYNMAQQTAANVVRDNRHDPEVTAIVTGVGVAACSVLFDLLLGDDKKSVKDIACDAAISGVVAGGITYIGAKIFEDEDYSMLGITALGITAEKTVIGIDKTACHFFNGKDAVNGNKELLAALSE